MKVNSELLIIDENFLGAGRLALHAHSLDSLSLCSGCWELCSLNCAIKGGFRPPTLVALDLVLAFIDDVRNCGFEVVDSVLYLVREFQQHMDCCFGDAHV